MMQFADRSDAGRLLGERLLRHGFNRPVVLALPRGGVPVARAIADALGAPLDILLVRRIGAPSHEELAVAAIVDGAHPDLVMNEDLMADLGLSPRDIDAAAKVELREIERRRALYLQDRPPIEIAGRDAIVVDDGIATGASMSAALKALRRRKPARIIVAVPVAPADTASRIAALADDVVCLTAPSDFYAVGAFYRDFRQLTDRDVVELLRDGPRS